MIAPKWIIWAVVAKAVQFRMNPVAEIVLGMRFPAAIRTAGVSALLPEKYTSMATGTEV
jgi:hypothetical protein